MVSGVQEENGSGQERLFEGLGCIQSESRVKGMPRNHMVFFFYYYVCTRVTNWFHSGGYACYSHKLIPSNDFVHFQLVLDEWGVGR